MADTWHCEWCDYVAENWPKEPIRCPACGCDEHGERAMRWFQHGDVTIQPHTIPAGAVITTRRVLAEGEVTGHAHRLVEDADVEVYEYEGTLFLRVGPAGAGLTHEEHGLGVLTSGDYRVGRLQEFDHFVEEARAVRD